MKFKSLLFGLAICQALGLSALVSADDWPQWLGAKRDGVWRESGILKKFPEGGPKVNWRVPIGGGYAGPAVSDGRVFIMDRQLVKGTANPDNQFDRGMIPGSERV
ncbi:MAG: pyrrolo-quinoline quinone, partial [Verrucomicrobiota bacterium]|nr:pyrrolo-quinoline quinone [Verrucomicrobiota bacterium]